MRTYARGLAVVVALLLGGGLAPARADVPPRMHIQGVLHDAGDVAVSAALPMTARIYDVASGGAPLYENTDNFWNTLIPHEIILGKSVHSYQVVEVEGPYVKVTTYNVDAGNILEVFEIGEPADCVAAADCAAETPGACEGEWGCVDFACVWQCAPPPECYVSASECPEPPAEACEGHWECNLTGGIPGACMWVCAASSECMSASRPTKRESPRA